MPTGVGLPYTESQDIADENGRVDQEATRRGSLMTEQEWLASNDPIAMLEALRAGWHGPKNGLVKLTHRYLLASCRAIWPLLPMETSRNGVEVATRYIEDRASHDEYADAEWHSEAASYFLDPSAGRHLEENPDDPEWLREIREVTRKSREEWPPEVRESERQYRADRIARTRTFIKEIEAIPAEEVRRMVGMKPGDDDATPHQLLADAAYFAHFAMVYPGIKPREKAIKEYSQFLSVELLREFTGTPYRGEWQKHWYNRATRYWR